MDSGINSLEYRLEQFLMEAWRQGGTGAETLARRLIRDFIDPATADKGNHAELVKRATS